MPAAPSELLRSPPPCRSIHHAPTVKVAAPIKVNNPTVPTSLDFNASSTSSNEMDPMRRPDPRAMTTAMNLGLGLATNATNAPTRSAEAATAPQRNASTTAGD